MDNVRQSMFLYFHSHRRTRAARLLFVLENYRRWAPFLDLYLGFTADSKRLRTKAPRTKKKSKTCARKSGHYKSIWLAPPSLCFPKLKMYHTPLILPFICMPTYPLFRKAENLSLARYKHSQSGDISLRHIIAVL